mmetsp:Transcript_110631/g.246870  ORF Transcript_110631/g.246870 Transcript_110631/m.246870 type:complete len:812 (-) Transcript_110631:72-2507(-)
MKGWFYMGRMKESKREAFQQRFPTESLPGAPLRALRYTSAGGQHTVVKNGLPVSALLKVAFDHMGQNVYSNKIVIMDEVHNLVRTQTQFSDQLARLRELLYGATGMVLAGFTGTPILNEPQEGQQLLAIIKGRQAPKCDEGFLSSFPMRPPPLFPRSLPAGVPDGVVTAKLRRQLVRKVTLVGEPLKRYDIKRQKGVTDRRLRAYCSLCLHFGSFHDGKNGAKQRILADMAAFAPKLHAIAQDVACCPEKALVLVARSSGMEALILHLRAIAKEADPTFGVATMNELAAFNAPNNRRGEHFRVLVADSLTCSEGVSFFAVRRMHLAEVPVSPSAFVQSVGRSIRMYGHRGLPQEEQTVTTFLHVAGLPRWMRSPLGAWAFRTQRCKDEARAMESGARRLLRLMMSLGIRDLETLKARIDTLGSRSRGADGQKASLTAGEVAGFLEQLGLWNEAKAVRAKAQKRTARRKSKIKKEAGASKKSSIKREATALRKTVATAATPQKQRPSEACQLTAEKVHKSENIVKEKVEDSLKQEPSPSPRKPLPGRPGTARVPLGTTPVIKLEPSEDEPLAALLPSWRGASKAAKLEVPSPPKPPSPPEPLWRKDPLVRAIMQLHLASSAAEAESEMHLSPESADEEALRTLAQRSREFVPALADLRSRAVDRSTLQELGGDAEPDGSEGESSVHEFGVSDSSGTEAVPSAAAAPLILPPGWRTEKFRRKSRECREFVDPSGRRYRTVDQAKRAVNAARGLENVAQQLRSKYAARMGLGGAVPPVPVFSSSGRGDPAPSASAPHGSTDAGASASLKRPRAS